MRVYEMRREAKTRGRETRNDGNRTAEERADILNAIRSESERSIAKALRPKVFKAHQKHGGDWLSRFADNVR